MSKWLIIGIVLAFFLSEITLSFNPVWGFLFYVLLLTGLLVGLGFEKEEENKLLLFLMILPIVRIAGLLIELPDFWKTILAYYSLAFLSMFYYFSFKLDVGFNSRKIALLPVVLGVGFGLGVICQKITGINLDSSIILVVSMVSFSEELFFRGLIQKNLEEYGSAFAIFLSAVLYGIFNLGFGWKFALFALLLSLFSAISYKMTKNVFLSMAINFGFQIAVVIIV